MSRAKAIRVWPVGYSALDPVTYDRGVTYTVHPDGDLTLERRGVVFAVWARGEWMRVETVDRDPVNEVTS